MYYKNITRQPSYKNKKLGGKNYGISRKKINVGTYKGKLEKAIKRQIFVKKELQNDTTLLEHLEAKKTAGDPIDNSVYSNYDEWIENIKKQIKTSENTLSNIELKKIQVEAFEVFLAQN